MKPSTGREMDMETCKTEKGLVVKLPRLFRGIASRSEIQEIENIVIDGKMNLILDLSETTLIDSTAIGKLINLAREMKPYEQHISIVSCRGEMREYFKKLKIDTLFRIE